MINPIHPVPVWFQPKRFLAQMKNELGINIVFGPAVENSKNLSPGDLAAAEADWIKTANDLGLWVVLSKPVSPVPANCYGWFIPSDEPNGHDPLVTASQLQPYVTAFRAISKTLPIFLSLAGSKLTSANWNKTKDGTAYQRPAEAQLILDYASLDPHLIFTTDNYSMNLNASRYKTTWTGDAIAKLADFLAAAGVARDIWAWIEVNDQQLPSPPVTSKTDGVHQDINREPTPTEIKNTWEDCMTRGAKGVGAFLTQDAGKYGWPDSFYPQVNRAKVSMKPQYDQFKALAVAANVDPNTPPPVVTPPVVVPEPIPVPVVPSPAPVPASVEDRLAAAEQKAKDAEGRLSALEAWAKNIGMK